MKLVAINYQGLGKRWCIINEITNGGEYTVCGNAWTDSNMKSEDFEATGEIKESSLHKVTCKNCKEILNWHKTLK